MSAAANLFDVAMVFAVGLMVAIGQRLSSARAVFRR